MNLKLRHFQNLRERVSQNVSNCINAEQANVEGGAKIPIPGMDSAQVVVGGGPTLRNVETAQGGVILTRGWNVPLY